MNQILLPVDEMTRRRLERAAARQNVDVPTYCLAAVQQKLLEDDLLAYNSLAMPERRPLDDELIADMRALRDQILERRNGIPLDLDIVELVRAERDEELTFGLF